MIIEIGFKYIKYSFFFIGLTYYVGIVKQTKYYYLAFVTVILSGIRQGLVILNSMYNRNFFISCNWY